TLNHSQYKVSPTGGSKTGTLSAADRDLVREIVSTVAPKFKLQEMTESSVLPNTIAFFTEIDATYHADQSAYRRQYDLGRFDALPPLRRGDGTVSEVEGCVGLRTEQQVRRPCSGHTCPQAGARKAAAYRATPHTGTVTVCQELSPSSRRPSPPSTEPSSRPPRPVREDAAVMRSARRLKAKDCSQTSPGPRSVAKNKPSPPKSADLILPTN